MLNIVIPMAGRGQRFVDAGYELPKPLIPVHGVPMIELVIANLRPSRAHRFHFLMLREHASRYGVDEKLRHWAPGSEIVYVDEVTQGAACTVLLARDLINSDEPLMIANCDQYVDIDINRYLDALGNDDGLIMTMRADDPKWSYARLDPHGCVAEVVEKKVISNEATVGIYNYRRGSDFVRAADRMIAADSRVNGEFYVAPAYNVMIEDGSKIKLYNIGELGDGMHGIGTPTDLEAFTQNPISTRVTEVLLRQGV